LPARLAGELVQDVRQSEVVEPRYLHRDETEGGAQAVALEEGVDPETRLSRNRIGEVDLPLVLEVLPLILRKNRVDELARVVGGEARVLERLENAVDADDGRVTDAQMQIARAALQNLEKNVDNIHCCPLDHWPLTDIL